jgi:hypothetical protein
MVSAHILSFKRTGPKVIVTFSTKNPCKYNTCEMRSLDGRKSGWYEDHRERRDLVIRK